MLNSLPQFFFPPCIHILHHSNSEVLYTKGSVLFHTLTLGSAVGLALASGTLVDVMESRGFEMWLSNGEGNGKTHVLVIKNTKDRGMGAGRGCFPLRPRWRSCSCPASAHLSLLNKMILNYKKYKHPPSLQKNPHKTLMVEPSAITFVVAV